MEVLDRASVLVLSVFTEQASHSLSLTSWAEEEVEPGQEGVARHWGTKGCTRAGCCPVTKP